MRHAVVCALGLDPDVVLFDELMSNLDVRLKRELLSLVGDLPRPSDTSALWVTHDPGEAATLGDRIAVLEAGRVVQMGVREDFRVQPAMAFVRAVADELAGR